MHCDNERRSKPTAVTHSDSTEENVLPKKRRMHTSWILAAGLVSVTLAGACSSGSSDVVPDAGGTDSSGSSSSSSGGSSSSSSGGTVDAGSDITVIFPFDSATSGTDVANWPGDTFCASQTSLPGTTPPGDDGGGDATTGTGDDGGDAASGDDGGGVSLEASTLEASTTDAGNACGTEVYLQNLSTLTYDPDVGDTLPGGDPGSLKIVIPFYGYNQQADFQHIFMTPLQNLVGQTLFVRVQLDSGFVSNPNAPGGFVLDVKSTNNFIYAQSAYTNIGMPNPAGWTQYQINISMPAMSNTGYDPTDIVSMELHFDTGSGPLGAGVDAGAPPTTATFHVDTIGYFPTPM
jgi:hypothetical protein